MEFDGVGKITTMRAFWDPDAVGRQPDRVGFSLH
jgi:hypothetical protein